MNFEELFNWIPPGWLTKEEAQLLYRYIPLEADSECALEVGCYKGRSTAFLAYFFKTLYAVDPMNGFDSDDPTGEKTLAAFKDNLSSRNIENVRFYRTTIESWTPLLPLTFAYLDGDHTYQGTLNQIAVAKLCKVRTIAIHDVNDDGGGAEVKRAALGQLGQWNQRVGRLAIWVL